MGSYLSEPVTEKVSGDDENDKLICGHSSMQGWRISQEVIKISNKISISPMHIRLECLYLNRLS